LGEGFSVDVRVSTQRERAAAGSRVRKLGRGTARLLFNAGWVHRRREELHILTDTWIRRRFSVDFTVPQSAEECGDPMVKGRYVVPVALLPKQPSSLMRFDFSMGGASASLPTRRQNALAAYAALLWSAERALEPAGLSQPGELPRNLRDELLFVATAPQEYSDPVSQSIRAPGRGVPRLFQVADIPSLQNSERDVIDWALDLFPGVKSVPSDVTLGSEALASATELQELHTTLSNDPMCAWLLLKFGLTSPVITTVDTETSRRRLIYLSYDENIFLVRDSRRLKYTTRGWSSVPLVAETPFVGARSYHFECLVPAGLDVSHSELSYETGRHEDLPKSQAADDETGAKQLEAEYEPVPIRGSRVHRYIEDADAIDRVTARISLRVARETFVGPAFWAAFAVSAALLGCTVLAQPIIRNGSNAGALLLLFPALLATLIARAGEHGVIIRMLARARRALLASGLCAYLAAALVPLVHTGDMANAEWWARAYWGSLFVISLWPTMTLFLARELPRPIGQEGWLGRIVARLEKTGRSASILAARSRQKGIEIAVRPRERDWSLIDELVGRDADKASPGMAIFFERQAAEPLQLRAGPRDRWKLRRYPSAVIEPVETGKTMARLSFRRSERVLRQRAVMASRLAATIRTVSQEWSDEFELRITWLRRPHWLWRLKAHLARWWRSRKRRKRGEDAVPVLGCATIAAKIRAGGLPIGSEFVVRPDPEREPS
jgi:hypothetical protein